MITPAQRAEIRRLYYAEHWKIGTIAAQLGLHRETVRAAVERESPGVPPSVWRPSIIDPYLPFIRDILTQYPRLRATRIHEMVRQEKQRRSVESRLKRARLGRFKPLADWDWQWPTALDRTALERILSLHFLDRGENVVILGAHDPAS